MSWHEQVNAGDEVIVVIGWRNDYHLHTVVKVTPSGQIVLDDGSRWTAAGWRYGGGEGYLVEATPERLAEIRRRQIREAITKRLTALQSDLAAIDLPILESLLDRLN